MNVGKMLVSLGFVAKPKREGFPSPSLCGMGLTGTSEIYDKELGGTVIVPKRIREI